MKYLFIKTLKRDLYDSCDDDDFPMTPYGNETIDPPISDEEYYRSNQQYASTRDIHIVTYINEENKEILYSVERSYAVNMNNYYNHYCQSIILFGLADHPAKLSYAKLIYNILLYGTEEQKKYITDEINRRIGYKVRIRSFVENDDLKEAIQDYLKTNWKEKIDGIFRDDISCIIIETE